MARASTTRATLLLVAVFAGGLVVGGAAMMVADRARHESRANPRERPGYADRLTTELGLSSEQRQAVEEILRRHEPQMDSLWRAMRNSAAVAAVRQSVRDEIRAQLTPEQQERYAAMLERQGRDDPRQGRGGDAR